jgi:hypothetical protein
VKVKLKKGPTKWYKPWSYPAEVKQAFRMLYAAFTKVPVLQHFDPKLPLMLIMDASDFAYAGILLQPATDDTGNQKYWHPIAYHSQKFADHEVHYHTHDKELHAIVKYFKQWQHYFEHAMHRRRTRLVPAISSCTLSEPHHNIFFRSELNQFASKSYQTWSPLKRRFRAFV